MTLQNTDNTGRSTEKVQASYPPFFTRMVTRNNILPIVLLIAFCVVLLLSWVFLRSFAIKDHQLSVKPTLKYSEIRLEPRPSSIGLQANIPLQAIVAAAEHATSEQQTGSGERQSCKKILGARVCATLLWDYRIARAGNIELLPSGNNLRLILPIGFTGQVSIDGRGGKLLGLRNKDIDGKLKLIADLQVNVSSDWCPTIDSTVTYEWLSDPKIRVAGNLHINLKKSVDKALQRKLTDLHDKLSDLIDCEKFRQSAEQQWRTHTLPVSITQDGDSHVRLTPLNASMSQTKVKNDHIAMSFQLGAIVELLPAPGEDRDLPLPALESSIESPGTVEFSLLLEIPYQQLQELIAPKIIGKNSSISNSGSVSVTSLDIYPSGQLLTFDIGLNANAVGGLVKTQGNIYVSAKPVVDSENNLLHLTEVEFTRSIDNKVVSVLSTLMRQQLLNAISKESTIDLDRSITKLENSVKNALSDPAKTKGIQMSVTDPQIQLMALNPQARGIAAIINLSTSLNATVPADVLIR